MKTRTHNVEQGTQAWLDLHIGIPTASRFAQIMTPGGRVSAQRDKLVDMLVAEWMSGSVVDRGLTSAMQRGLRLEREALDWFAYEYDVDVERVGFVTLADPPATGCSPDGLLGDVGMEVKIPLLDTHVGYLRRPGTLTKAHWAQLQGSLWICGRPSWRILCYHPDDGIPNVIEEVERDEDYIAQLAEGVALVNAEVHETLVQQGFRQPKETP